LPTKENIASTTNSRLRIHPGAGPHRLEDS
jgi:hypothetical protein